MADYDIPQVASHEEARKARLPVRNRGACSALLIPLNKCRHRELYAPWKCTDEKHTYEACLHEDLLRRMRIVEEAAAKERAAAAAQ